MNPANDDQFEPRRDAPKRRGAPAPAAGIENGADPDELQAQPNVSSDRVPATDAEPEGSIDKVKAAPLGIQEIELGVQSEQGHGQVAVWLPGEEIPPGRGQAADRGRGDGAHDGLEIAQPLVVQQCRP